MKIIICEGPHQFAEIPSQKVENCLKENPAALLVFPTGTSPLPMYEQLCKRCKSGQVSFAKATLVELDDYCGIPMDDRRNLFLWLKKVFLNQVDFQPEKMVRFNTEAESPQEEVRRVESYVIGHHGIDLLVLGLGPNGHIGFNEPGTSFDARTRVIELTPESLKSNARYWGNVDQVPRQGYTLGMDLLLQAKETLLLVNGERKAAVLKKMIEGPITEQLPATCLRLMENVTIIADAAAASALTAK